MADPTAPGVSTSEWTLTKIVMVVGGVLETIAGGIHVFQDAGINFPWFSVALALIGFLLQASVALGYIKSRTLVKAAAIASDSPPKT